MNMFGGQSGLDKASNIIAEVKQTRLQKFLSDGTLERAGTYRLRTIAVGDAKMKDFLKQWDGKYKKGDFSVHHLISVEDADISKLPVMLKAQEFGYNINRKSNLIPLPNKIDISKETGLPLHDRRHIGKYSKAISDRVNKLNAQYGKGLVKDEDIIDKLGEIEDSLRSDLLNKKLKLQNHDPNF